MCFWRDPRLSASRAASTLLAKRTTGLCWKQQSVMGQSVTWCELSSPSRAQCQLDAWILSSPIGSWGGHAEAPPAPAPPPPPSAQAACCSVAVVVGAQHGQAPSSIHVFSLLTKGSPEHLSLVSRAPPLAPHNLPDLTALPSECHPIRTV